MSWSWNSGLESDKENLECQPQRFLLYLLIIGEYWRFWSRLVTQSGIPYEGLSSDSVENGEEEVLTQALKPM